VAKAEDEEDEEEMDGAQETNGAAQEKEMREAYVYEGNRLLFEPELGENAKKTLAYMGVTWGKSLTITDYEGDVVNLVLVLLPLPPDHGADAKPFVVPSQLPHLPPRPAPPPPSMPPTPAKPSLKRSAPEDGDEVDDTRAIKRIKTEGGAVKVTAENEMTIREENGVLILDDDEDDVVELD